MSSPVSSDSFRRFVYVLLITIAAAQVGGRILAVVRVYEPANYRPPDAAPDHPLGPWPSTRPMPMATLGSNDRSRWVTVRALVDEGTYAIGHRDLGPSGKQDDYVDRGIFKEDGWGSVDVVLHPKNRDFYSSKPPLLPTLLAGEYWLLKHAFGWSITDPDGMVVRVILLTVNWVPLVFYLIVLARMADRCVASDWGRLILVAAGCFATFLTPFSISLNNHTVATWSALFALYFAFRPYYRGPVGAGRQPVPPPGSVDLVLAGLFAGFTAANELPAASFLVGLALILIFQWPDNAVRTAALYLPAAAVPVAGLLLTNYLALGQLAPAYSEVKSEWYQYPGSHWKVDPAKEPKGIDWAYTKENKAQYAFHLLLGHHGLFSLTPIFLAGLAGMLVTIREAFRRRGDADGPWYRNHSPPDWIAAFSFGVTVVVVGFYIKFSDNYGGWTSGPRWLMWLSPLFLVTAGPCFDWLAERRGGRLLTYLALGISVLSVSYPAWNPWRHPWLYDLMASRGLILY